MRYCYSVTSLFLPIIFPAKPFFLFQLAISFRRAFYFQYYKCRTTGCKCNRNAEKMHALFKELLLKFTVKEELIPVVCYQLEYTYHEVNKEKLEQEQTLRLQFNEVAKKIGAIEEKHFVLAEMSKETFDKFKPVTTSKN